MLKGLISRETGLAHPIVLARAETTRRIYSLDLCKHKTVESVHAGPVNCLDIDPAEYRYLLSGGSHGRIAIHDVENLSGRVEQTYSFACGVPSYHQGGHSMSVEAVQWYQVDSGMFVSSSSDGTFIVWDTNALTPLTTHPFKDIIYSNHMSPLNGRRPLVAVGSQSPFIRLMDMLDGSTTHTLKGHQSGVFSVRWSSFSQNLLASGCQDGRVLLWDLRSTKKFLASLDKDNGKKTGHGNVVRAHDGTVNSICFSANGHFLVTFGRDNRVRLWDAGTGKNTRVDFGVIDNVSRKSLTMGTSEDGSSDLVWVPSDSNIIVLDLQKGMEVGTLRGHLNKVYSCIYQPRTQQLFSSGADCCINVWGPRGEEAAYDEYLNEDTNLAMKEKEKAFTSRMAAAAAVADAWSDDDDDDD